MDCMAGMAQFPDKYFDLAIADPPYGIENGYHATSRIAKYCQLKTANDAKPGKAYFEELFRVSKNQIIWGYNHLSDMLPATKEFVFWYKHQPVATYSDGELAWTSFTKTAKCFDYPFYGAINCEEGRCHPMQKPVALYRWLLCHYTRPGDKIIDTHVGSGSSLIACIEQGHDYIGFEICPEYYRTAGERIEAFWAQQSLFDRGEREER
jgi:site-specific DNA-methyltransferase (adenine-specific)